ncbi:MAG: biotin/lipoate A/B protein ligase family protein [Dehalococcoidia bacterium]
MLHVVPPAVMDEPPWLDTAVSWALLQRTGAGAAPETLRLVRPARTLAFGPADRLLPGYEAARTAARALGFAPVTRLAGGHAAVFHEDTIAFSWTLPDPRARMGIRDRFEVTAAVIAEALRDLGVDARIGAVPGEYCAGDYSVSAGGRTKLMGVGQRVLARAAYVGGVIVVDRGDLVRDALEPVYRALDLEWAPATAGSVRAEAPGVTWDDVASALLAAFARRYEVRETSLDPAVVEEARAFEAEFGDVAAP